MVFGPPRLAPALVHEVPYKPDAKRQPRRQLRGVAPRVFGCQTGYVMTSQHAYLSSAGYETPLPTRPVLISQEEMVARIEAARLETADRTCQTCGAHWNPEHSRVCYCCGERKPLAAFAQKHDNKLGREYLCKACKRVRAKVTDAARYAREKRAAFRAILGGAT